MKKLAIYARYSSDNQNPKSVDDQIADCLVYAKQHSLDSDPLIFSDSAVTGRHAHRTGYTNLIKALEEGKISVVLAEGLDRFSRDLSETAGFFSLVRYYDAIMLTILEGPVSKMHIAFKGTMNDMYIDTMKHQVIRSHRNRMKEGKMFSLPYGYKVAIRDEKAIRGEREIHPVKGAVVLRIFNLYAQGHSLGSIVKILNSENIASPSGGSWTKQSLMGSRKRRDGLLNNEIYRGRRIWNMKTSKLNPKTAKRKYVMNPESEWNVYDMEHLRIVSDEIWYICEQRKDAKNFGEKAIPEIKYVRNPLSGLVFCGVCDSKKTLANKKRYVCSSYKGHRRCKNARGMDDEQIYSHLFRELEKQVCGFSAHEWKRAFKKAFKEDITESKKAQKSIVSVEKKISLLTKEIETKDIEIPEVLETLKSLNEQRIELRAYVHKRMISVEGNVRIELSDSLELLRLGLLDKYKNDIWRAQLMTLIEKITLHPIVESRSGETVEIKMRNDSWVEFYRLLQHQKAIAEAEQEALESQKSE